ncbi:hypothetical protein A2U01_0111682, partial [Trifolium medium]|nr:hypothetical protein [Trifolium medium]
EDPLFKEKKITAAVKFRRGGSVKENFGWKYKMEEDDDVMEENGRR